MVKKAQSGILADLIRSSEELLAPTPGKRVHDKWVIKCLIRVLWTVCYTLKMIFLNAHGELFHTCVCHEQTVILREKHASKELPFGKAMRRVKYSVSEWSKWMQNRLQNSKSWKNLVSCEGTVGWREWWKFKGIV